MKKYILLFLITCTLSVYSNDLKKEINTFLDEVSTAFIEYDTVKIKSFTNEFAYNQFRQYTDNFTNDRMLFIGKKLECKRRRNIQGDKSGNGLGEWKVEFGKINKISGYEGGLMYIIKQGESFLIKSYFKPIT